MISETFNMDCIKGMKQYPDKYFDLAVVDPPYGIGMDGGNIGGSVLARTKNYKPYSSGDDKSPEKEYFDELIRVSKSQIIWGANHFISKIPFDSSCWLVWDKQNGDNNFADCELAWTSFETAVRKFEFRWAGMLQGDMKNKEERLHPNQKPVKLYDWILKNYAKDGDKILDTHLGSQSSRIASWKAKLDFVGFETDIDYFQQGNKRFEDFKKQLTLF